MGVGVPCYDALEIVGLLLLLLLLLLLPAYLSHFLPLAIRERAETNTLSTTLLADDP